MGGWPLGPCRNRARRCSGSFVGGSATESLALEMLSDVLDEEYQGPTLARGNEWRMGVEINGGAARCGMRS